MVCANARLVPVNLPRQRGISVAIARGRPNRTVAQLRPTYQTAPPPPKRNLLILFNLACGTGFAFGLGDSETWQTAQWGQQWIAYLYIVNSEKDMLYILYLYY